MDLIATYYRYDPYSHDGTAYYVYRVKTTEEDTYSTDTLYNYYYVSFHSINTREALDLSETSENIRISSIFMYNDKKTDAEAIQKMKNMYSDLETVSENASSETFQDVEKEKKN